MSHPEWSIHPGLGWGLIELGQTRTHVVERLRAAGIEFDDDDSDPEWLAVAAPSGELVFSDDEPHTLRQIAVDEPAALVQGQAVVGQPLDQALLTLGVQQFADTLCRTDWDPSDSLDLADPPAQGGAPADYSTDELLTHGTLWIRSLGLGLVLENGRVGEIILRQPPDVPLHGYGPLTPQHLEPFLHGNWEAGLAGLRRRSSQSSPLRRLATTSLMLALGVIFVLAIRNQQRWQAAPRVQGEVIAREDASDPGQSAVHIVRYQDHTGRTHRVRWTLSDLYVPLEVGATVEVAYLPEAPERPLGPMGLRDLGFKRYFPYAIAAFLVYGVVLLLDRRR